MMKDAHARRFQPFPPSPALTQVIKFQTEETSFSREREARDAGLDTDLVVPILISSASKRFNKVWVDEVQTKLGLDSERFKYGFIMPAAARTLTTVLQNELLRLPGIKKILRSLARSLHHIHEKGRIHGDFNSENSMRMADGLRWSLSDMDSSVEFGKPCIKPSKVSPPELTCKSEKSTIMFRPESKPLLAAASYDAWSFGVVIYRVITRKDLFPRTTPGR